MQQIEIEEKRLRDMTPFLLAWFDKNKRSLLWREDPSPYHVWVSEIMLQQTRVEAVKGYYVRFLEQLPDIVSLAEADEDVLLKLWEGLGYYNRVRNMQKAAITVMDSFHGQLPSTYPELLSLCGIGSYTAGAIASIAYGCPVPAVDGNVLRVITRICADETDISSAAFKKSMEKVLGKIIPTDRPGIFNQALMELGAIVCVPNGPANCHSCPVKQFCEACRLGKTEQIPVKAPKKKRVIEEKTVFLIRDGDCTALKKRRTDGLLAGLYEFPNTAGYLSKKEAVAYLTELGFDPIQIELLPNAKHIFTHREWHMRGYYIRIAQQQNIQREVKKLQDTNTEYQYVFATTEEMDSIYPLPSAFSMYKKMLYEVRYFRGGKSK